jgi:Ni/Co efflux regulator RcnB
MERLVAASVLLSLYSKERYMRKFGFVIAAAAALAIAVPSMASAQTVVIKTGERGMHRGHHNHYGARAQAHRHHGWHRGHGHSKKVVVIKRGHRHHHHHR